MKSFSSSMCIMMIATMASRAVIGAEGRSTQGLRIEIVNDGDYKGICTQEFYTAAAAELFDFTKSTAATILQEHSLSVDDFEFAPFYLGSVNVRARGLLRGDAKVMKTQEQDDPEQYLASREMKLYWSTCSSCTSKSCSAYCSGCYLCSSGRRELSQPNDASGDILAEVKAALQGSIGEHLKEWLADGAGSSLAVGCMGNPKKLKVSLSLE